MVAGQTNTGENIRCKIHIEIGMETQNGSLVIRSGGVIIRSIITIKCITISEYKRSLFITFQ